LVEEKMRSVFAFSATVALTVVLAQAPVLAQTVRDVMDMLRPSANTRVVGGMPAKPGAWPWQVLVVIPTDSKGNVAQCGGSLIGEQWILTAAHCIQKFDRSRQILVVEQRPPAATPSARGVLADIDPKSLHRVSTAIAHPQWNINTLENDIALLKLNEPAVQSHVVPLLLSPDAGLENPPAKVVVTGWGVTRDIVEQGSGYIDAVTQKPIRPEDVLPDRLMEVELPLVATDQCRASNHEVPAPIDHRNLCAGVPEGGKDDCRGDSGGPLVGRGNRGQWVQIGIVSWGIGCGRPGHPGVYTRVSAFADWIRESAGRDLAISPGPPAEPGSPPPAASNPTFDNSAGLTVAFDKGDVVGVGDVVSYRVTTQKPGYLAIFDATPDHMLTQVFPNARSMRSPTGVALETARLSPERPRLIPDPRNPYEGFAVRIVEPRGKGFIVAVLSDQPITNLDIPNMPKAFATVEEAATAIGRLRSELSRGLRPVMDVRESPKWSIAVREYTVR
jgi:secreted trypsin-like serine protease